MSDDPMPEPLVGHVEAGPNAKIVIVNELHGNIQIAPQRVASPDAEERAATLERIRRDWIEGVLNQSLYRVARIELGLAAREDAVELPLNAVVQIPDRVSAQIEKGTSITQVFDQFGRSLLILGAPGTGKTTVLLELTKGLLDRAQKDEHHQIPAVFNLSTWALRRQPLVSWLIAELHQRTGVPKRLAQEWVAADKVIPLLDGLDEVEPNYRLACLEAINEFQNQHGLLPIAVCSRLTDLEALGSKLRLRSAIVIQPLTREQVDEYLRRSEKLVAVHAALRSDASLFELLETPLMLWVAMLAYRDAPIEMSSLINLQQRRDLMFEKFLNAMFKRRAGSAKMSQAVATDRISWLASSLARNKQTVFYLEDLDFHWFHHLTQRLIARVLVGVICSLAAGLLMLLTVEVILGRLSGYGMGLASALVAWLVIGLIFGVVSMLVRLKPTESLSFRLRQLPTRLTRALGPAFVVSIAFIAVFLFEWFSPALIYLEGAIGGRAMHAGLLTPLLLGISAGLGYTLIQLFTADSPKSRIVPNQGTYNSVKTATFATLIFAVLGSCLGWFLNGPPGALTLGPSIGLSAGLMTGGLFSLKHFTLRVVLWMFGCAPLRYVTFLHEAASRLLLYRVGGGYIFIHRMLQEYLISLRSQSGGGS